MLGKEYTTDGLKKAMSRVGAIYILLNVCKRYLEDYAEFEPIYKRRTKFLTKELVGEIEKQSKSLFKLFEKAEVEDEDLTKFIYTVEDMYEIIETALENDDTLNEFINHNQHENHNS